MKKALVVPLLLMLFVLQGEAAKRSVVEGVRFSSYDSHTRIVVDLTGKVEFTRNRLANPERIYFDLKKCFLSGKTEPSIHIDNGVLRSVRTAQFNHDTVRVVLDIDSVGDYSVFTLEHPFRLVVDVYPDKGQGDTGPARAKTRVRTDKKFPAIRTVVIDPGHGGKDPGAIGPKGLREKDITLNVGKKLGRILKKKYDMNIIYTRERDKFVPLNDRTELANSSKADLFISIHVNASRKRSARGIETYFLNWTNNREAMRVAARENKISFNKMQEVQDSLQMILQDLARKNKNEESMRLAHSVQNSMVDSLKRQYHNVEDLGVKYALFYVLVGAEMPSVLVEISFISNREEEKRLLKENYRDMIAEAIARGIDTYVKKSTLIVSPAAIRLSER